MSSIPQPPTAMAPRFFDPLEQADFQRLEHAASLKGLLRPFKGKGELLDFALRCEALRAGVMRLAQRLLSEATAYPFNLLPVVLTQQTTAAGTTFLRWRNTDRSVMGVALWTALISDSATPRQLLDELLALEVERVVLNMQISVTHSIARQARDCAEKMAQAESAYRRRASHRHDRTPLES